MGFKCPKCSTENVSMMVDISIVTDAKYLHMLTKKALYAKETEVWGAMWDRASFFCKNPACRHNMVSPNPWWVEEVQRLRKENQELKDRIANALA
jgi:hypothetical protein